MSDDGTCDTCGRPLPTQRDADEIAPGKGEEWCWREWQGGVCMGEPVDWRQRFLAEAEARVAAEGACDCAEAEVARLRGLLGECSGWMADACDVVGMSSIRRNSAHTLLRRLAAALEKDHG